MFFFFQAEDGIRDIGVTGVQTCALPIYMQKLAASWYTGHRWSGAAPSRESRCPPGVRRRSRLYWQSAAANPKRAPASLNGVADGVVASYLQIQDRKARCCW